MPERMRAKFLLALIALMQARSLEHTIEVLIHAPVCPIEGEDPRPRVYAYLGSEACTEHRLNCGTQWNVSDALLRFW